jgi:hypothetical protein
MANSQKEPDFASAKNRHQCVEHVAGRMYSSLLFGAVGGIGLLGVFDPVQEPLRLWFGGALFLVCAAVMIECLMKSSIVHSGNRVYSILNVELTKERITTFYDRDELLRASERRPDGREDLLRCAQPDTDQGSRELLRANRESPLT